MRLSSGALLYHSRFRYVDRVERHKDVVNAFGIEHGSAFAITTQVAEMSLDLSADLLITELAPIPALIQRLGRLNRRAKPDGSSGIRPFIVTEPESPLPYRLDALVSSRDWLKALGDLPRSQADLVSPDVWHQEPLPKSTGQPTLQTAQFIWLDGGFCTEAWPLREASPGLDVILRSDVERLEATPDFAGGVPNPDASASART